MGLAIVSMIVLAIMALVAVPVFGRVAGVAPRRNENRPEGGSAQGQPGDEEIREGAEALKRTGPFFGGSRRARGTCPASSRRTTPCPKRNRAQRRGPWTEGPPVAPSRPPACPSTQSRSQI